ncbi:MAG: MotA/TolQ/ExbB proton channel family protein [Pseudomonadota bacterium]
MLTETLFRLFTSVGAEWVMWLLIALSIASVAVIVERLLYFRRNSSPEVLELLPLLSAGKWDEARKSLDGMRGLEAEVLREALDATPRGAASVEDTVAGAIARRRTTFERFLPFLGTLGSNAPFVGLFGTVIGIIEAFASLAREGQANQSTAAVVMAGISEALVATAVGIFVAIPAVVAFNLYSRWLKTITSRAAVAGGAVVAHLRREA